MPAALGDDLTVTAQAPGEDKDAVVVTRGTAQIFTQSMLHAGWHNSTDTGRKGFIIGWAAAEVRTAAERLE